jgi:glycosyltransferase involved in cell wall biosynthesis
MQLGIGIDFTSAAREQAGIGRYARELVRALARLDHTNRYELFVPRDARDDLLSYGWPSNFSVKRGPLTERLFAATWQRARIPLPIETFIGTVQVLYSPDFLLPPTRAKRKIVTVHDLSYVRLPECFPAPLLKYLNASVPRALGHADLVLADAGSTRRDLNEVYGVPLDKIRVLYSGVDPRFQTEVPEESKSRVSQLTGHKPYLLSVGTIQPRKNYSRLIEAFSRIANREMRIADSKFPVRDLQLIIAGGRGWMFEDIFETTAHLGISDRVRFLDFFPDVDLPALYSLATLFVYPSLYEGFGLPIAEAMACGTPVVTSNASSLPEVAGDAALYFDPRDVDAMAGAMQRALGDENLRANLMSKGREQAKKFSWDKAASELAQYLTGQ